MAEWRLLTSSLDVAGSPTLLVKHHFEPTSYRVYLTDLTYLWTEVLDRRGIIRKALNEETSIDPSEGPDQLKLLLNHIRLGLDGQNKTTFVVSAKGSDKEQLDVSLASELPPPLKSLSWKLNLQLTSQEDFSKEVVLPMMHSLCIAKSEAAKFSVMVKEKDQVIGRIRNSLSSRGHSFNELFRELVPAKVSAEAQYEALLKKVPGLAPFDEEAWHDLQSQANPPSRSEIAEQLFYPGLECWEYKETTDSEKPWWESLGTGVEIQSTESPPPSFRAPRLPQETSSKAFDTQDASLSPEAGSPSGHRRQSNAASFTATDSTASDLDAPVLKSPPVRSPQPPRKLGTIGGRRAVAPSSPPATTPRKRTKSPEDSSPPPSEAAISELRSLPQLQPQLPSASAMPAKSKAKLGRIGGSAKPSSSAAAAEPVRPLPQSSQLPTRGGRESSRIGAGTSPARNTGRNTYGVGGVDEGGDGGMDEGVEEDEDVDAGRRRETAEAAAADRRRAETKKRLEEQRKAPAKKKRKF